MKLSICLLLAAVATTTTYGELLGGLGGLGDDVSSGGLGQLGGLVGLNVGLLRDTDVNLLPIDVGLLSLRRRA